MKTEKRVLRSVQVNLFVDDCDVSCIKGIAGKRAKNLLIESSAGYEGESSVFKAFDSPKQAEVFLKKCVYEVDVKEFRVYLVHEESHGHITKSVYTTVSRRYRMTFDNIYWLDAMKGQ